MGLSVALAFFPPNPKSDLRELLKVEVEVVDRNSRDEWLSRVAILVRLVEYFLRVSRVKGEVGDQKDQAKLSLSLIISLPLSTCSI